MSAVIRRINFGTARKYGNKPATLVVDGEAAKFDSRREADAFTKLRILEKAERIRNLKRQVSIPLEVNGRKVCRYVADFTFEEWTEGAWKPVIADAKGYPTAVYRLKKKLVLACLGMEIREL